MMTDCPAPPTGPGSERIDAERVVGALARAAADHARAELGRMLAAARQRRRRQARLQIVAAVVVVVTVAVMLAAMTH
jgi:hypothetical protein